MSIGKRKCESEGEEGEVEGEGEGETEANGGVSKVTTKEGDTREDRVRQNYKSSYSCFQLSMCGVA